MKLCANLSFLFTEHPFLQRFETASAAQFEGCEYLFPYAHEPQDIAEALTKANIKQVLFNLPAGDWDAGDRGMAAVVGQERAFKASVETALRYAEATGCRKLHIMAGCVEAPTQANLETYLANLDHAAKRFADAGITGLIEPINPIDMPGYFLTGIGQALDILTQVNAPNLKLQFDCYHCAMMHEDVLNALERAASVIGHIQIAGAPGRHEPNTGALDYKQVFQKLTDLNYQGWIGCEYRPQADTTVGLGWRSDLCAP